MEFKDIFKNLRQTNGYSQVEISRKLNISRSLVSMYESGERAPTIEGLETIADFFNVDIDYLTGRSKYSTRIINMDNEKVSATIPVLGKVAAGIPINAIQEIIDTEEIPAKLASTGQFFGLQIRGNSMEPRICNGDVVIVRQQPDAESGDIVIATINGDEATCKRLRKYKDGIELIPNNPTYEPMYFSKEDIQQKPVRILGKVIELRGKF